MEKKHIKSLEKDSVNGKTMETNGADSSVIDRISHLPNEVICHILSFLPTKYAVGTCILSTRWKNLFPLIPNLSLQLDDTLLLHPESTSDTSLISFTNFTSRLLNITLRDVPSMDALRIVCRRINDGQEIADWVRAALLLNVKKLTLLILQLNNSNLLFDSLFGCNIVSLNLFLDFADDDLELRFSFPNLNTLSVQFMKSNLVNAILASSPLLEYLVVHRCNCSSGEKLQICSPSLKGLRLVNGVFGVEGEIEIDCASLEYLNYGGLLASRYVVPKLKSIWVAHLNLEKDDIPYPFLPDGPAIELLKACCVAERLLFSQTLIRILHSCPHALPRLPKLAVLIINYMDSQGWELLLSFLQCAPNLKTLLLKEGFDKEHYEYFKASLKEPRSIFFSQHNETGFFFEIARKVEN